MGPNPVCVLMGRENRATETPGMREHRGETRCRHSEKAAGCESSREALA